MKIAIVHDWLTVYGGAEKVVASFHKLYKDAPIYTLFYNKDNFGDTFEDAEIKTSFLQGKNPVYDHRKYFPFMPLAFRSMNLKKYDMILSSSSSCAKGVKKGKNAIHICYIHTPMRYAYEFRDEYLSDMNIVKRFFANILLVFMRIWDKHNSKRVDYFIANSSEVKDRVYRAYGRDSVVINPPVSVNEFYISEKTKNYYFIVSRLVKYKHFDLAIKACKDLGRKLIIIGDGPDRDRLEKIAGGDKNIRFLGFQDDNVVHKYMSECKALIFPTYEDFGIVPVEAEASGRPVICYGKGGVLDTVVDGKTGVYFNKQTPKSLEEAIIRFEKMKFNSQDIRKHAMRFSEANFRKKINDYIESVTKK